MNHYYKSPNSNALRSFFGLRKRYLFTRSNRLRLRYSASALSCALVACVAIGMSAHNSTVSYSPVSDDADLLAAISPASGDAVDHNAGDENLQAFLSDSLKARISDSMRAAPDIIKKAEPQKLHHKVSVGSGQTIAGVLQEAGVGGKDTYRAVKALGKHFDPRRVRSGQKLDVNFKELADGSLDFDTLSMKISPVKEIVVAKNADDDFSADIKEQELERKVYGRVAQIETSLYGSAARADIPSAIIAEMIRIYSWNVDFQRDIRRGDKVEVMYEAFETEDGDLAKYGNIIYASLNTGGREKPIYRYKMDDGRVDYFEPDGTSIRKTLMKTPVDGARISSGFGYRRHPVLGYNKLHKGMDFAAPTGTPIYAAGDGVLEYAARNGSFGNYARIRHNSKLKTAYAHMSKFKKGMHKGKTVKQGEVIGYIGTTGRSTGPHLHYEVLVNGVQVNPRSVKLPTGETLTGEQLKRFKSLIQGINQEYASLTKGLIFAFRFGSDDQS